MKISIVMATFGKSQVINNALDEIYTCLTALNCQFEVCVVIDGDFDGTHLELQKIKREFLQILRQDINVGKGASQRLGFQKTSGDIVIFIDSDGQINPTIIARALEVFVSNNDVSVVAADKFLAKSQFEVNLKRRILSRCSIMLINTLFRTKLSDAQTGFKAYRRMTTANIIQQTKQKGYLMDLEAMILLDRLGLKIHYIPVEIRSSLDSNINMSSILSSLRDLLVLRLTINRNGYLNSSAEIWS